MQGRSQVGDGSLAENIKGFRILSHSLADNEFRCFRNGVRPAGNIHRIFFANEYRNLQIHGVQYGHNLIMAFLNGSFFIEVLRQDALDNQLRTQKRLDNGKGIVGFTGCVRIDNDPYLFFIRYSDHLNRPFI